MDLVIRGVIVYLFLFIILRAAGNRQFSELTAFDAVLIIIISEATQQGLIGGQDFSLTGAMILIATLVSVDILISLLKDRFRKFQLVAEGSPVLIMENGRLLRDNMRAERVDEDDILAAARELQGIESMDQIKFAILERDGRISIIPQQAG